MKRLLLVLASHALCVPVVGGSIYAPESASGGSFNYGYDTSGNRLTDGQGQVIQMGLRGFAEQIKQGTAELNFRYNPGGQRYVQAQNDGSKKFYLQGDAFEYHLPAGGWGTEGHCVHQERCLQPNCKSRCVGCSQSYY